MIIKEMRTKSYAKINLSFDIIGTLDNGYHEIESVMQQISLYDDMLVKWNEEEAEDIDIMIKTSKPYIPTDSRNIVYKAIEALIDKTGFKKGGKLEVHIKKRIPVAAGMGGGSGNGASILLCLNELWDLKLDLKTLMDIGAGVGADLPFSILTQGTDTTCAVATGFGEILEPLKKGLEAFVVVAKPNFGVSTREVFRLIDEVEIKKRPDTAELKRAIEKGIKGERTVIYEQMINVLEAYTLTKYPRVSELKEKIAKTSGAQVALMTGSGSTCFGLYNTYKQAKSACLKLREEGYEAYWVTTGREKRK